MFMVTRLLKDDFEVFEEFFQSACFLANFWQFYLPLWEIPEQLQGQTSTENRCIIYNQKRG